MTEYPGRADRELARSLIASLPPTAREQLSFGEADLEPAAEHVLYTALRHRRSQAAAGSGGGLLRGVVRPVAALATRSGARGHGPAAARGGVVVLITQPVHARLFGPIADRLVELGEPRPLVVAARTGEASHVRLDGVSDVDLRRFLPTGAVPRLIGHAARTWTAMRRTPSAWQPAVGRPEATRLRSVLSAAIPRLAVDVARLAALLDAAEPRVLVCFSESGLLARLAPAAASRRGVPVRDLPHAEAADPWGTSGAGYDGVAVFGPRSAEVMRLAGIAPDRVVEIGPLGSDDLLGGGADVPDEPRRVLFASQPVDERVPYLTGDVKRLALGSAVALAQGGGGATVHVLPHPTEDARELHGVVASVAGAGDVPIEIEPAGMLHALLPGAFALVTVSSQSVLEAAMAGVPAIVVHPAGTDIPATHVADGLALRASSVQDAGAIGQSLVDPGGRAEMTRRSRLALAGRLGPLDGHAADRAAQWLHEAGLPRRAASDA